MNPTQPSAPLKAPEAAPKPATETANPVVCLPPAGSELLSRSLLPFQPVDHSLKGYHLDATVVPEKVIEAAAELAREGFALDTITGVDWLAQNQMEVVYDYFHPLTGLRVVIRTRTGRDDAELPSIAEVFPGAAWHERETHDFFGIRFSGHPNLVPFLLPEDATYHPLRKDFTT